MFTPVALPFEARLSHDFATQVRRRQAAESRLKMERNHAREIMRANGMPDWVRDVVFKAAEDIGVSPADVMRRDRRKPIVRARRAAMYETRSLKRKLSSKRIAGWFGRDHTTVEWALGMYAIEHGLPMLTGYNFKRRFEMMPIYWATQRAKRALHRSYEEGK